MFRRDLKKGIGTLHASKRRYYTVKESQRSPYAEDSLACKMKQYDMAEVEGERKNLGLCPMIGSTVTK